MEIVAAFIGGVVAGGCGSLAFKRGTDGSLSATSPPLAPPPPPPPLPVPEPSVGNQPRRVYKSKKLLKLRCDLHLEAIVDPVTGEDLRGRSPLLSAESGAHTETKTATTSARVEIKLTDVVNISTNLKKAPRQMSIDEKREAFFAKSPLFTELLSKKKTVS